MGYYPQESLYKPYKYHGYTVRGTPNCPLTLADDTVDGSEMRRSPVEVGSLSHYSTRFIYIYIPGGCWGFLNHPQYVVGKNRSSFV